MAFRSAFFFIGWWLTSALCSAANAGDIFPLKRILLADTEAKAMALQEDAAGNAPVYAESLPLYSTPEFQAVIAPFIGKPIDIPLVNQLIVAIMQYAGKNDWLLAKVLVPQGQVVSNGTIRFAVVLGRYSDFSFQGSNRWFSQKLLRQRLGLKPGDEIRLSTLEEAVNWLNMNPFRQVKVLVNETPNEPGKGQLVLHVEETIPLRAAFSFDDTGNAVIGKHHYAGLVSYGNLWGLEHQLTYNYVTTGNREIYQGHGLDYRVPLRLRHYFQVSANYVRTHPTFAGGFLSQKGENFSADARYTIPLRTGKEPRELSFGASFKESNNNLEFGGTQVLNTKTDTFQLSSGFSTIKRDKLGAWLLSASVHFSPGNINSRNTTKALEAARSGARARYIYGTISAQRLHSLSYGWEAWWRATVQASSHNLLSSEQLLIGGANTVRGYEENVFAGERGFVFNTDLMTPVLHTKLPFLSKKAPPLDTRLLGFLDMAKTNYKQSFGSDITLAAIASTGLGLRSNLSSNFSLSFDYGWQLMHTPRQPGSVKGPPLHSRGHLKVVLAF